MGEGKRVQVVSTSPTGSRDCAILQSVGASKLYAIDGPFIEVGDASPSGSSGSSSALQRPTIQVLAVPGLEPITTVQDIHDPPHHFVSKSHGTNSEEHGVRTRQGSRKGNSVGCSNHKVHESFLLEYQKIG